MGFFKESYFDMDIAMRILFLLAGCGVFLMGLSQMSSGLERCAGPGMKRLFARISKNRVSGYGLGAGATVLVQSSSATSVMAMALAGTGIITLFQGASIILGAKLGTTMTGIIIAFFTIEKGGLSLGIIFSSLTLVGVMLNLFCKVERIQRFSLFLTGFGLLFLGLEVMGSSFKDESFSYAFTNLFAKHFNSMIVCTIAGMLLTVIVQSSSAASGIFLSMLGAGVIKDLQPAIFLMVGANIGTCITAMLASIGAPKNARRIAFFHLFTSIIGAVVLGTTLVFISRPLADTLMRVFPDNKISLALFNVGYNLIYSALLLPFINPLINLTRKIIKDKPLTAAECKGESNKAYKAVTFVRKVKVTKSAKQ